MFALNSAISRCSVLLSEPQPCLVEDSPTNTRVSQCNGIKPCLACSNRGLSCTYTVPPSTDGEFSVSPTKRRTDHGPSGSPTKRRHTDTFPTFTRGFEDLARPKTELKDQILPLLREGALGHANKSGPAKTDVGAQKPPGYQGVQNNRAVPEHDLDNQSANGTARGPEEDTKLYSTTRMLKDPMGRLRESTLACSF